MTRRGPAPRSPGWCPRSGTRRGVAQAGLPLAGRWGNEYASIDLGKGAAIGLHPARGPHSPKPGSSGSIQVGFAVDKPLDDVVKDLQSRGVAFRGPIVDDVQVRLAFFGDPDGNDLYLVEVKKWS